MKTIIFLPKYLFLNVLRRFSATKGAFAAIFAAIFLFSNMALGQTGTVCSVTVPAVGIWANGCGGQTNPPFPIIRGFCPFSAVAGGVGNVCTDCASGAFVTYYGSASVDVGQTGASYSITTNVSLGYYNIYIYNIQKPGVIRIIADVTGGYCSVADCTTDSISYEAVAEIQVTAGGSCGCSPNPQYVSLGNGACQNDAVYQNLDFQMSLGKGNYYGDAGALWLQATSASSSLSTPNALQVPYTRSITQVLTNGSGLITQILVPQGLVNVNVISTYEYHLECYAANQVGSLGGGGVYSLSGSPFETWKIVNPNGSSSYNQLNITDSKPGVADREFQYTFTTTSNQWAMVQPDGTTTVTTYISVNSTNSDITNYFQVISSGSQILRQTELTYQYFPSFTNTVLLQGVGGVGTLNWATNYTYYSTVPTNLTGPLVQSVYYPDGNWNYSVYDNQGRLATNFSAYGTNAAPTQGTQPDPLVNLCEVTSYYYSLTNAVDGINDEGDPNAPFAPRKIMVQVPVGGALQEVSRTYDLSDSADGQTIRQRCPIPGAAYGCSTNLVYLNTVYMTSDFKASMPEFTQNEDGTVANYDYSTGPGGNITNVMNAGYSTDDFDIYEGTQTTTVTDGMGRVLSVTVSNIDSGSVTIQLSQKTYTYSSSDPLGRDYTVTDLAGRSTTYDFDCCGLSTVTDPDGVVTSYGYDTGRRLVTTSTIRGTSSVVVSNILDGVGQILGTVRYGTDNSAITLSQSAYDVIGRVILQTNALGGVTTISNMLVNSQLCVSNLNPDGGTMVTTYCLDGTVQSVLGTAVAPVEYLYGAEQDGSGGPYRLFADTIKLTNSSGGTNEWTKVYSDGVGNNYKTIYAGAGSNPYSVSVYNSLNQLISTTDPDGYIALYGYDGKGELTLTVLDTNQNYTIDLGENDRVTMVTNDVLNDTGVGGVDVMRRQTFVWETAGLDSPTLVSTSETSTDGLRRWNILWNSGQGVTNFSQVVYGSGGYRYATNITQDGAYTVSTYLYGLLQSSTRYDSNNNQLLSASYGYDTHFRQNTMTDPRNGTTTNTFNNTDQINSTITPIPATGLSAEVTSNYFDNLGRNWKTTLPDGTSTTNLFYPTGNIEQTSGSRTYPVGYAYDAQGRTTAMTNWSNFASGSGARITTWSYDQYRGFLIGKTYNGGVSGPSYAYTAAGRLYTRTWARGTVTTYSYDTEGSLSTVIYSDGTTPNLAYGYDRRRRQIQIVQGGTFTTALTYNDQGQVLTESYSGGPLSGISVTNGYDLLLRRTNNVVLQSTTTLTFSTNDYDAASRLLTVSDGTNSATYSYLANSTLVSNIVFQQSGSNRMTTTKQYDFLNRLTSISSANASSVVLDSHNYVYNTANQRTSVTNADGTYWDYGYDSLGQVTSGIKHWPDGTVVAGQQFGYAFDNIGNRTMTSAGGDQWGANLRYASYSANTLNQYTNRTVPGAVDIIGSATNTATVTVNNLPTIRKGSYYRAQLPLNNGSGAVWQSVTNLAVLNDGTNFIVETNINGNVFLPQTPESFGYDADGNLTNDGRWYYTWDGENRLISMTNKPGIPAGAQMGLTFTYDSKSRRISKSVTTNGVTTTLNFVYDGWNLLASLASGAITETLVWGLDLSGATQGAGGVGGLLFESQPGSDSRFISYDANGNAASLLDAANGATVGQYEYGPFGEVVRVSGPAAKSNPFRFSTKFQDDETGLFYYMFRYYNPSMGIWLGRDLIEEIGDMNLYGFLNNDPTDKIDFLGLDDGVNGPPASVSGPGPNRYSPEQCAALLAQILAKTAKLAADIAKYNPVTDGQGGWPTAGGGLTKPGGHYIEIQNLKSGIESDIKRYLKNCRGCPPGPPIPKEVYETLGRPVEKPVPPGLKPITRPITQPVIPVPPWIPIWILRLAPFFA